MYVIGVKFLLAGNNGYVNVCVVTNSSNGLTNVTDTKANHHIVKVGIAINV